MIKGLIPIFFFIPFLFLLGSCTAQKSQSDGPSYTNALIDESSPYLLQHAHNPVNWYPWSAEALDKARKEDKLLLISIGYSACHWCHVMEHESFEDTVVANFMNRHFVSIKIDREERPDVDEIYMTACQLSSEQSCGWPLNAFALANGEPIFAGTYFPKKQWLKVLNDIQKLKENNPKRLEQYAASLTEGVQSSGLIDRNDDDAQFPESILMEAGEGFTQNLDLRKGGRKQDSPSYNKFPMPTGYLFLQHYLSFRFGSDLSKNTLSKKALRISLDAMAAGGIYDHLRGGFARYSTDPDWKVPHFEKMLYDNAQLVSLYANAYRQFGDPAYRLVFEETLEFIHAELTSSEGAFFASLDADSEGEEGKFYIWKKSEIDSILGIEAERFNTEYSVTEKGNWEHQNNILFRNRNTFHEIDSSLETAKTKLLKHRNTRIRPGLDDKSLTAWNALMLTGYLDAYAATGNENYLATAKKNAQFLENKMLQSDYRLNRNYKDGKSVINAFLDDYALLASAWLDLYEASFEEKWLNHARSLMDYAQEHFFDSRSEMYFYTSDLDEPLIARKMELFDNVIPASNSIMARNWFRLGHYFYQDDYLNRSATMLNNMMPYLSNPGREAYISNWLNLYVEQIETTYEVAIVGPDSKKRLKEMQQMYLPNVLFLGCEEESELELLKGKYQEGKTLIYVCRDKVCKLPVETVEEAVEIISNVKF